MSLEKYGWELESARVRHEQNPDSFEIPDEEELHNLKEDDWVKLLFLFWEDDKPENNVVSCERMWVSIVEFDGDTIYGQLENKPATSDKLEVGDIVDFAISDVCSILIKKGDPRHALSDDGT